MPLKASPLGPFIPIWFPVPPRKLPDSESSYLCPRVDPHFDHVGAKWEQQRCRPRGKRLAWILDGDGPRHLFTCGNCMFFDFFVCCELVPPEKKSRQQKMNVDIVVIYLVRQPYVPLELLCVRDSQTQLMDEIKLDMGDFLTWNEGWNGFPKRFAQQIIPLWYAFFWHHGVRWLSEWGDWFRCVERWYSLSPLKSSAAGFCPTEIISLPEKIVAVSRCFLV